MTLLSSVQAACNELGLVAPSVVAAATDLQTKQLFELINRDQNEMRQMHDWTGLQTQFIVNAAAPVTTTGNVAVNSAVITGIPTTAAITAGSFVCSGTGIPSAARVLTVDSGSQVTLDMLATATGTGVTLVFAQDTFALPADFDHYISRTWWDRTNRWQLLGPDSPQIDQWHRSGLVVTGPRRHFRQVGHAAAQYRLWPPPTATDTPFSIVFEYVSKYWCASAAGVAKAAMTADDDVSYLDEQAMILGIKWRFFQIKQFDYAPLQQEYLDYVARRIAQDGGADTLNLARTPAFEMQYITSNQVPDGNWS